MNIRACQVCGSTQQKPLHEQKFFLSDEQDILNYTIVNCSECGFVFATNIPSQQQYEKYYNASAKYTYDEGEIPQSLKDLHQKSFHLVDDFLKKDSKDYHNSNIIDIGCSTAYLLNCFKKNGYKKLIGLEPSTECCEVAGKLYGIEVLPCALQQYKSNQKYDLAIMTGVLEHINDLSQIELVASLLKENGHLFTMVPDASNFSQDPKEPFHEFSLEHINFYTSNSLANLLANYGFKLSYEESIPVDLYDSAALAIIWTKNSTTRSTVKSHIKSDLPGVEHIKDYIKICNQKLGALQEKIDRLVDEKQQVVVWGVGSLTSRLLINTNLAKANIEAFVDSNKGLHGKNIKGIPVCSPNMLKEKNYTVFIASKVYGEEIKNTLIESFNYQGDIVLID